MRGLTRLLPVIPILAVGTVARCEEPVEATVEATVEVHCPAKAVIGLPLPVRLVVHGGASLVPPRLPASTNPFSFTLTCDTRLPRSDGMSASSEGRALEGKDTVAPG